MRHMGYFVEIRTGDTRHIQHIHIDPQLSQTCNCKKGSDWLKKWVEAQHNIFKL